MNIFRELVEELKEENLLEETVIDPVSEKADSEDVFQGTADRTAQADQSVETVSPEDDFSYNDEMETFETSVEDYDGDAPEMGLDAQETETEAADMPMEDADEPIDPREETPASVAVVESESTPEEANVSAGAADDNGASKAKVRSADEERNFYRQRAMDEVTGLQLVEHVLSGVEREQMKSSPKTFDDLAVKRALHDFLKVADNINSPEHAQAEFQLMQETENWASALSRRDRNISVAHLRRYCETTKPSLSSQAMISLARFYRNSPFSESVRSKFDLVFTKLFSKDVGKECRAVVFKNKELIKHIQELYADWSSIPLYSTEDDDSELLLAALKFQDFINEAKSAESFDEMIRKDFFKRLKVFKEKTNENFFAPILVAAAIESNVAVGNRYVELIEEERHRSSLNSLGEKYGVAHDNSISDATSKTLELLEILQSEKPEPARAAPAKPLKSEEKPGSVASEKPEVEKAPAKNFTIAGGVNKWLIVAALVAAVATGWFYLSPSAAGSRTMMRGNGKAVVYNIEGTFLRNHVHSARISKNTLYGITQASWLELSDEEKREFVEKAVELGESNDFRSVHLLNMEGQSVAFGSKSRVKIY